MRRPAAAWQVVASACVALVFAGCQRGGFPLLDVGPDAPSDGALEDLGSPPASFLVTVSAAGFGENHVKDMALDGAGNIYLIGDIEGPTTFSKQSFPKGWFSYLAKLGPHGKFVWVKPLRHKEVLFGPWGPGGGGIDVTDKGAIWITGSFWGSFKLGPDNLTSSGELDIFVAHFNSDGTQAWSTSAGGPKNDTGTGIAVDDKGEFVYLSGTVRGKATFGSISIADPGVRTPFVARFDAGNKKFGWVAAPTCDKQSPVLPSTGGLALDASGNPLLADNYVGTCRFGSMKTPDTGHAVWIVASADKSGKWLWSTKSKTSDSMTVDIAASSDGKTYVTGADGYQHDGPFVARLEASTGTIEYFAEVTSSAEPGIGTAVVPDDAGGAFVTGLLKENLTVSFDSHELTTFDKDGFLARVGSDGKWKWAVALGGSGEAEGRALARDSAGNLYVAGTFSGTGTFGKQTLKSKGSRDLFVWKIAGGKQP